MPDRLGIQHVKRRMAPAEPEPDPDPPLHPAQLWRAERGIPEPEAVIDEPIVES